MQEWTERGRTRPPENARNQRHVHGIWVHCVGAEWTHSHKDIMVELRKTIMGYGS